MNCKQCGQEMRENAKFCKNCGAPIQQESAGLEGNSQDTDAGLWLFLRTRKKKFLLATAAVLVFSAGAAAALFLPDLIKDKTENQKPAVVKKTVSSVDLQDVYEMEDNKLVLDPLSVSYEDGTSQLLTDYRVYIDTLLYEMADGAIAAEDLYDGKHLVRLEWQQEGKAYQYEKTVTMEHKKDTWEKYVDLVGKTGKEIVAAYGPLGEPIFAGLGEEDWGYAYADVPSLSIQVCFPVSILDRMGEPEDYGQSDAQCVEMSGIMDTFFYNLESEMSLEDLANTLNLTLAESEAGGCTGTLSDGKLIYIGEGQVMDGIYTPDTQVRVSASEEDQPKFLDQIF
ncbi:MAG: zinc-ribbon domain-containing protein [Firmicutes bacterium]|nr:zinc-ribbon domain-containing protein [Bacillota bacterium]NBI62858.1 zinc ribbon domain-containing protein [Clostridiales bacterium]